MRILKPDGQVRVSVPHHVSDKVIEQFVLDRLEWIAAAQQRVKNTVVVPELEFITGEHHKVFGETHELQLLETKGKHQVMCKDGQLFMYVKKNASKANKEKLLNAWYRSQLLDLSEQLIQKWQPIIGKQVKDCRIKNMKTRWGTCHIQDARIWLNLLLAQYPASCVEYIVVHEMTHLHERLHNKRFHALMDGFLPDWRGRQLLLNQKMV